MSATTRCRAGQRAPDSLVRFSASASRSLEENKSTARTLVISSDPGPGRALQLRGLDSKTGLPIHGPPARFLRQHRLSLATESVPVPVRADVPRPHRQLQSHLAIGDRVLRRRASICHPVHRSEPCSKAVEGAIANMESCQSKTATDGGSSNTPLGNSLAARSTSPAIIARRSIKFDFTQPPATNHRKGP